MGGVVKGGPVESSHCLYKLRVHWFGMMEESELQKKMVILMVVKCQEDSTRRNKSEGTVKWSVERQSSARVVRLEGGCDFTD